MTLLDLKIPFDLLLLDWPTLNVNFSLLEGEKESWEVSICIGL